MPLSSRRPLLPSHYSVWCDPPDEAGDETLRIVSERRSLKLKGRAFREFTRTVVPLLDGRHTLGALQEAARDVFRPEDLAECLALLEAQGVLVDGDSNGARNGDANGDGNGDGGPVPNAATVDGPARLAPQRNFLHDAAPGLDAQAALARATVAVLGLGGAGVAAAQAALSSTF